MSEIIPPIPSGDDVSLDQIKELCENGEFGQALDLAERRLIVMELALNEIDQTAKDVQSSDAHTEDEKKDSSINTMVQQVSLGQDIAQLKEIITDLQSRLSDRH